MQVSIINPPLFQFSKPAFHFGQRVKTAKGAVGYVTGLDFYPEIQSWAYGICVVKDKRLFPDDTWYRVEELEAVDYGFVN